MAKPLAVILRIPLASMWKVTWTCGTPSKAERLSYEACLLLSLSFAAVSDRLGSLSGANMKPVPIA